MLQRLKYILGYWLMWVMIFQTARCVFLLYHYSLTIEIGLTNALLTLWHGLRMDISMAAYFSAALTLILIVLLPTKEKTTSLAISILNMILVFLSITIVVCDLPAYASWGYRLDATPLRYLTTPSEAIASVSHLPVFWIGLGWVILIVFVLRLLNKFIKRSPEILGRPQKLLPIYAILVFLLGIHILPIRGGIQLAPINQSSVYFSQQAFANHSAVNVTWNFFNSLTQDYDRGPNPFVYINEVRAKVIRDSIFHSLNDTTSIISAGLKPNIIVIIWESGTQKIINQNYEHIPVSPGFSKLIQEGVYFSNIYATGDRTDKGIVGVLSGYPAQPVTSIIKNPTKSAKLPTLPAALEKQSYQTAFTYGGELEFANMKAYLLGCGFNQFISKNDFSDKDQNSKWGAHDGVVADTLLNNLRKTKEPFFSTWLTLSSHEPFETPVKSVFSGSDETSLFMNSLHYTDSVLYHFIEACKKESFWKNTIVVIIADHGHPKPETNHQIDRFKIPMLWLGGALNKKGLEITTIGSQTDLAATLLHQLGLNSESFVWSRNLLSKSYKPSAYFSFNNGFGYTQGNDYFIFDNNTKNTIEQSGSVSMPFIETGKAIQQRSFGDYLSK